MIRWLVLSGALLSLATAAVAAPLAVEPFDLVKHEELVGRFVSVDGRVRLFQRHQDRGIDELILKGTPVVFRLPPRLRFQRSPDAPAVRVEGVLRRDGDQWFCDVTELELYPNDLERLNRGIGVLPPGEYQRRNAWALWGAKRGREYGDKELLERALAIEDEAIRIEGDHPGLGSPERWLALARRGRDDKVPEPGPSALAHRAFRRRLEKATTLESLKELGSEIAGFFPNAATHAPAQAGLAEWAPRYANDPAATYRAAPVAVRAALDRALWADTTQRILELQSAAEPANALDLASQAATLLPERPEVARRLLDNGLKSAALKVSTLRLREVQALAQIYRVRLKQPDRAQQLLRDWLDDQREHRLSKSDAEGRIILAAQYEELLNDRATAIALLREAWKLDPGSKEIADAFRRRNYRKVRDEWVDPSPDHSTEVPSASGAGTAPVSSTLRGKTPVQVRALLGGEPTRIVYSASRGQLVEQWIYLGTKQNQYINFLHSGTEAVPTVISSYVLGRTASPASSSH